jgi:hypothetical protein
MSNLPSNTTPYVIRLRTGEMIAARIEELSKSFNLMHSMKLHAPVLCMLHPMQVDSDVVSQGVNFAPWFPGGDELAPADVSTDLIVSVRPMAQYMIHRYETYVEYIQNHYKEYLEHYNTQKAIIELLTDVNEGSPVYIVDLKETNATSTDTSHE